jgi:hypothetical protein
MASHGDLKVWWIPQIPGTPFEVRVNNLIEARLLLDTLAYYDMFQLEHRIKGDYANVGGLAVYCQFDDLGWIDWLTDEGNNIDFFTLEQLRNAQPTWEMDNVATGTS